MNTYSKALAAVFTASLIWGFNPVVSKILLEDGTPLTVISIRFLFSSLSIFAFLLWKGRFRLPNSEHIFPLFILGLFSVTLTNTASFIGLQYSTVVHAALINALAPLLIAGLAFVVLREQIDSMQWCGILLAFLGTLFLLTKGNPFKLAQLQINQGDIYFLSAQFTWAVYTLLSAKILKQIPLMDMVAWSGLFGAGINIVYGSFSGDLQMPNLNPQSLLSLAYVIWLSAMLATLLWNYGVKHIGASLSGIFINVSTLVAVISGIIFLGEPFATYQAWGGLGIICGILILTQHTHIQDFFKGKYHV